MTIDERLGILLSFEDALVLLDDIAAAGRDVWGPEGFRLLSDGRREARLDLVLDVSCENMETTALDRIERVRAFLIEHQAPDIAWEIWAPDAPGV